MRSSIISLGGERVTHVKELHYNLLIEIGYIFGYSVSVVALE